MTEKKKVRVIITGGYYLREENHAYETSSIFS